MTCSRCTGLVVAEWDMALGEMIARCVNCAFRPFDPSPHLPPEHHLSKKRVGDLHHCRCGREKVEWWAYCMFCRRSKRNKEQRRQHRLKQAAKQRKEEA